MTGQPLSIVEVVFPLMTQLDFTAPHQVFSRLKGVAVRVASATGGAISSHEGLTFAGTERLADIEACDVLFIPGGMGIAAVMNDAETMGQVRRLAGTARYLTSVCTGSLVLAAAGLLRGRRAACHWAWRDTLALFGAIPEAGRMVRDGDILTGGGVTAGLDFAFTVAAELVGQDAAEALLLMLEYAPEPPFPGGRPELARPEVRRRVEEIYATLLAPRHAEVAAFAAQAGFH
ncbi:DJ-1/PfpI family protein [Nitrospirillum iridis]|uniref:Transcriptional regulator GlxA family with amidase domain n=1 Tax=Nitrospirillum iridis TaxID=765888 RepID=A0A7X0AZ63_9PROT|nr:DJ-1/PfpI family protein [Nitrospirillum iridis]MBB6252041.1 transcriptional regulator GlxA family with amidase domain [Nitrospirillum iridis]